MVQSARIRKEIMVRSLVLLILVFTCTARAAESAADGRLKVGVFDRPPLAMKDEDGHWRGLAVELWESVAGQTGLSYEYVETPLDRIVTDLDRGTIDLAVGEIGVSSDRERLVDFTQPFLVTTAAVALDKNAATFGLRDILATMMRQGLLPVAALMLGFMLFFSLLLWFVERRGQRSHFGGKPIHGFGSALWFAVVTMTTVGYGDKTPQTVLGRTLAFVWMFLGIVLVSAFTGSVASSITLAEMNRSVTSVRDLARFRNGVVTGSLAENFLSSAGIHVTPFGSVEEGLTALENGRITALIGNDAVMRYTVRRDAPDRIRVATIPGLHVTFAMASRRGLPQLQAINVALIDLTSGTDWNRQVERWLGPPAGE